MTIQRPMFPEPIGSDASPCPTAGLSMRPIGRRTLLTGAVATALAAPAAALAASTAHRVAPDPIFAAIEAHRVAYLKQLASSRVHSSLNDDTPEHEAAEAIWRADWEASDAAAFTLIDTTPTSRAGMLSLLIYAQQFNDGHFALDPWPGDTREDWNSARRYWPALNQDGDDDGVEGGAPFAWGLLDVVARFLAEGRAG